MNNQNNMGCLHTWPPAGDCHFVVLNQLHGLSKGGEWNLVSMSSVSMQVLTYRMRLAWFSDQSNLNICTCRLCTQNLGSNTYWTTRKLGLFELGGCGQLGERTWNCPLFLSSLNLAILDGAPVSCPICASWNDPCNSLYRSKYNGRLALILSNVVDCPWDAIRVPIGYVLQFSISLKEKYV